MLGRRNHHFFLRTITPLFLLYLPLLCFSQETDTIYSNSSLTDPNTISSSRHVFQLGYFSPPNTTNRYLGIFFTFSPKTILWVANRDRPLNDSSGSLTIAPDGNLVLTNGRNETLWSTNITISSLRNTSAQIQDSGNLVLRDNSTGTTLWESFSQPSDMLVPTMPLSDNMITHHKVVMSSWRSPSDPAVGNFSSGLEALNIPQLFIWQNGRPRWRSGPWNGHFFSGIEVMYSPNLAGYGSAPDGQFSSLLPPPHLYEQNGTSYFVIPQPRAQFFTKVLTNSTGISTESVWNEQRREWEDIWVAPQNECEMYGTCGPFGSCSRIDSPICSCLRGFEPANRDEWNRGNWTSGCVRVRQLQCSLTNNTSGNEDGFLRLPFMKWPDFAEPVPSMQLDECRITCSRNCSCIAYAHDPIIGCMFWRNSLTDVQRFDGVGVDLYIRLAASEFGNQQDRRLVIIIPAVVGGFAVISISIFIAWCWIVKRKGRKVKDSRQTVFSKSDAIVQLKDETDNVNVEELPLFTFETVANATDQFGDNNILGQGGFGPVYKGILPDGKEIAVKRLSAASGQGNREFINEMVVISKLQHRNLVRLSGCCVEREEKMLIYEFMPNKSLDRCLFDHTNASRKILDWKKRTSIIEGIGRGLMYLHNDSRLKIIHRDLKPSNVLLDENWNPKISDFGMAKIFGGHQEHGDTARVVGTYGYMAPEYAVEGRYSGKSDVYSFGVLMLEIISGKKNTHYYNQEFSLSLLGCAWKFWNENNVLAFADQEIASPSIEGEILRCINIALLCVQEFPNDRPTIETVLSMLCHEIVDLPSPAEPVFAEKWNASQVGTSHPMSQLTHSVNELTLTVLDGR